MSVVQKVFEEERKLTLMEKFELEILTCAVLSVGLGIWGAFNPPKFPVSTPAVHAPIVPAENTADVRMATTLKNTAQQAFENGLVIGMQEGVIMTGLLTRRELTAPTSDQASVIRWAFENARTNPATSNAWALYHQ